MRSLPEIAGRIRFLEGIKEEYLRRKNIKHQHMDRIKARLHELYWVLGLKIND